MQALCVQVLQTISIQFLFVKLWIYSFNLQLFLGLGNVGIIYHTGAISLKYREAISQPQQKKYQKFRNVALSLLNIWNSFIITNKSQKLVEYSKNGLLRYVILYRNFNFFSPRSTEIDFPNTAQPELFLFAHHLKANFWKLFS